MSFLNVHIENNDLVKLQKHCYDRYFFSLLSLSFLLRNSHWKASLFFLGAFVMKMHLWIEEQS